MLVSKTFDRLLVWLTVRKHNQASFSALRIIFGVGLLLLLLPNFRERSFLWGEASFWVNAEAKRRGFWTFDTLFPKDNPLLFDLAYVTLTALVVLFIIGAFTRIVLPVMLVMLVALQSNNPYVLNGGDTLIRITLLFMLFANLTEHLSVDKFFRHRRLRNGKAPLKIVPSYVSNAAHNVGLFLCGFQIIVVYVVSGVWKLIGTEWLDGTALFYALRIEQFMLYPALNELLWQSSLLIYLATFLALWAQTLFPVLLLWRPSRIFALITLMGMHLGIALLMGLWPFSLAMIALDMLFIRDSSWRWMLEIVSSRFGWSRLNVKSRGQTEPQVDPSSASTVGGSR